MLCSFLGDSCSSQKENGSRGCGQHRQGSATSATSSVSRLSTGALAGPPRLASLLSLRLCGVFAGAAGLPWAGILHSGIQPNQLSSRGQGSPSWRFSKVRGGPWDPQESQGNSGRLGLRRGPPLPKFSRCCLRVHSEV